MVNGQSPTLIFVHDSKGRTRYCGVASRARDETLVNKVLPLPSSPLSANTEPAQDPPQFAVAIASVSAGLLEMNVATGQFAICDFRRCFDVTGDLR